MRARSALKWTIVAVLWTTLAAPALTQETAKKPMTSETGLRAEGAKRLGASDFTALYVGNTLSGTTADGDAFHVFVESASRYRMFYQGKRTTDRWSVGKDGEFCATSGADTSCTREYAHRDVIYSFDAGNGTLAGTARLRKGNPEGL